VPQGAVWAQFAGGRPGTVPSVPGRNGKPSGELTIYENAIAVFEGTTGSGKDSTGGQIQLGTLIRIGDVWKTISAPGATATPGIFFQPPLRSPVDSVEGVPIAGDMEAAHTEIGDIETSLQKADAAQKPELFRQREAAYVKLFSATKNPDERRRWVRQYADLTAYSVQAGDDPEAKERLVRLRDRFAQERDMESEAYIQYQLLSADYNARMSVGGENIDYAAIQSDWFASLEKFIAEYPECEKAAQAMFQLGSELELMGNEEKAKEWYTREASVFGDRPVAARAEGALRRINAIGNPLRFSGKLLESGQTLNLERLAGKVVLICYWTSWNDLAKDELRVIRQLSSQYASKGLVVVAVNLDHAVEEATAFLNEIKAPTSATWYNVREEGGPESAPAVFLGVHQTPTMLLVDEKGVVYERPQNTTHLTRDLKRMLR
ncbi:MAG: thioredoxin-like domain-containing protein, partial [Planctomycetia bacterium]|nr:thioredoxin-like domain-containing protein [Planctomycetia bacterium]